MNQVINLFGFEVIVRDDIPKGTMYIIPPRRVIEPGVLESLEDWAKRCGRIINIGWEENYESSCRDTD